MDRMVIDYCRITVKPINYPKTVEWKMRVDVKTRLSDYHFEASIHPFDHESKFDILFETAKEELMSLMKEKEGRNYKQISEYVGRRYDDKI